MSVNAGEFLLHEPAKLTNRLYCNSQCEAFMNRVAIYDGTY